MSKQKEMIGGSEVHEDVIQRLKGLTEGEKGEFLRRLKEEGGKAGKFTKKDFIKIASAFIQGMGNVLDIGGTSNLRPREKDLWMETIREINEAWNEVGDTMWEVKEQFDRSVLKNLPETDEKNK